MIEVLWIVIFVQFIIIALQHALLARLHILEDKVDRYHHEKHFESFMFPEEPD